MKISVLRSKSYLKKAREPHGITSPKYEPVVSHSDPGSARNSEFRTLRKLMRTHKL